MILEINSSHKGRVSFAIFSKGKKKARTFILDHQQSHKVGGLLKKFLAQEVIDSKKNQIKKIVVIKKGGSFTGVRVGMAIGMALSLAWQVPLKVV